MTTGDKLVMILAVINCVVAVAYAVDGQWTKVMYWISASGINFSLAMMR